jgi:hypothetical protein
MKPDEFENDRRFCLERVVQTAPQFRITRILASGDDSDLLLSLYALFGSLDQLAWLAGETELLARNIEWWGNELIAGSKLSSRQPVLRLMAHTGAFERIPENMWTGLLYAAATPLEVDPPNGTPELMQICTRQYRHRIPAELTLLDPPLDCGDNYGEFEARAGFLQLVRAILMRPDSGAWWIPSDVLARYQKTRSGVMADQETLFRVLSDLVSAASARNAGDEGKLVKSGEFSGSDEMACNSSDELSRWRHRHLLMFHFLVGRQLERLNQTGPGNFIDSMNRLRPGDFLAAWRQVRKFS